MFIQDPNSEHREGIEIDEYNGKFSLVASQKGKDGKVYKQYCYPQGGEKGNNFPKDIAVPWKIGIGKSAEAALKMLRMLADELRSELGIPENNEDDDCPF